MKPATKNLIETISYWILGLIGCFVLVYVGASDFEPWLREILR